jgi:hypothetical protein
MTTLLPNAEQQFIDANGAPYAAGTVTTYVPGTSTPKATWRDAAQSVLNTNPIVLDAAGRAVIYGSGTYRTVLQDSAGLLVWDKETTAPDAGAISPAMQPVVSAASVADAAVAMSVLPLSGGDLSGRVNFGDIVVFFQSIQVFPTGTLLADWTYIPAGGVPTTVGTVTTDGTTTSYNTTSDYRLKNVHGPAVADETVMAVPVHDAAFKALPDERRPMFLAHEVQAACPWAVTGEKDATDHAGAIMPQMIDHASLVPVLWASVQELLARVATLEGKA